MITNRIRRSTLAAVAMALLVAVIGCSSSDNPLTSSGNTDDSPFYRMTASGDVEIYGRVSTVDAGTRTIMLVNNPTVIVANADAEIVLRAATDIAIELGDISPGDSLEARGVIQGDGSLAADRIRIRHSDDNGGGAEVELYGRVQSIDPAARTMQLVGKSSPITVMANAEVVHKISGEEIPIELSAIVAGDSVEVRGTAQADGSLLADRVRLRASDEDFPSQMEIKSIITSIDYTALTLMVAGRSETITTDANTYIFLKVEQSTSSNPAAKRGEDDDDYRLHKPLTFADLSVGDTVEVYANSVNATTLYAVAIEVEDGAFESGLEVEFKDVLATVDASTGTITFVNQVWVGTVDGSTDLRGFANDVIGLNDFAAGQLVEVKGFKTGDATMRVVHMHKDNN